MTNNWLAAAIALAISVMFWAVVSTLAGVAEPWDARNFWTVIYPAALALAWVLGLVFSKRNWVSGIIVMLAQIPIVLFSNDASGLLVVGVLYALVLAIPAMALGWVAGAVRRRAGGR